MNNSYFPFQALGYQCNPFRAVTNEEWVRLAVLHPQVEAALAAGFEHLQVLGEKGHGKTTTLLAIEAHFKAKGQRTAYEHLEVDEYRYTTQLEALDLFCLDEAQRLTPVERVRLLETLLKEKSLHVVLGSHEDFGPAFARRGLTLTTLQFETVPLAQVEAVVGRRLSYFALAPDQPTVKPTSEAIAALYARFGADMRKIEQALYEAYQVAAGRPGVKEIDEVLVGKIIEGP